MTTEKGLAALINALEKRDRMPAEELAAVRSLRFRTREFDAGGELIEEGTRPSESCVILEGFAARVKHLMTGARQITAVHIPGDFVDLHGLLLRPMDHSVTALTRCSAAFVSHDQLVAVSTKFPHLSRMFWLMTLIDAAIHRAWLTTAGQLKPPQQIGHLLCELFARLKAVGLVRGNEFDLPLTQSQLADVLGLSIVHVNRSIQKLRATGFMTWQERSVTMLDYEGLAAYAHFDPDYLNLTQEPR